MPYLAHTAACFSPRASRQVADLILTGRGKGRKAVRRAARQCRICRGLPGPEHRHRELAHLIGDGQSLPGAEGIGEGRASKDGVRSKDGVLTVPACSFVQVEVQCEDPNLMQCGLEKCVAVDGSVEWVSAHSKVRLVSLSLSNPFSLAESQSFALFSGPIHASGRHEPHLEPAQPGADLGLSRTARGVGLLCVRRRFNT